MGQVKATLATQFNQLCMHAKPVSTLAAAGKSIVQATLDANSSCGHRLLAQTDARLQAKTKCNLSCSVCTSQQA